METSLLGAGSSFGSPEARSIPVSRRRVSPFFAAVFLLCAAGALVAPGALRAEDAPRTVDLGIVSRTFFYLPVWAAQEQGFFKNEGLDVKIRVLGNESQVGPLLDRSLQIAIAPPEGVIQNVESGGPLRFVAGNCGKLSHFLIAQPRFKRIEDLRGATFGILSMTEGSFFHVQALMSKHGMHYPDDYKVVQTGGAPPRHKALLEGKIDAALQSIPLAYVEEDGGFSNLADISDYVPDWQFTAVNVNREWASENEDTLVRFLRAMLRATDWVYRNREEAVTIVARELKVDRPYAARGWDYYTKTDALTRDLGLNRTGITKVVESQVLAKLIQPPASMDPEKYIEPKYLEKARRTHGGP